MKIGSHVGNSGPLMLAGSVNEALSYKANCFMLYLGSPQTTLRKSFELYNSDIMKNVLLEYSIKIEDCVIHAPYIVNLASFEKSKQDFAVSFLTQELLTIDKIGFKYLIVHPGSHMKMGIDSGLINISNCLKKILQNTINTKTFIAIETMAGKGSECCFEFSQIKKLMDLVNDERICVCLDTCHIHDAGYDIVNNYEEVLNEFDKHVGLEKIKIIHLNDSKNERGTKKDRHENIGFGKIGFDCLMKFVNDQRFKDIPKILETPYIPHLENDYPPYKYEIEMIKSQHFNPNLKELIIEESTNA